VIVEQEPALQRKGGAKKTGSALAPKKPVLLPFGYATCRLLQDAHLHAQTEPPKKATITDERLVLF
jgi:hypothetical protein